MIMMRAVASRRARAIVAGIAEVVDTLLNCTGRAPLPTPFRQCRAFGRQVVNRPVPEYPGRSIRIFDDQNEASRFGGRTVPLRGGETFSPSQGYFGGIGRPSAKVGLLRTRAMMRFSDSSHLNDLDLVEFRGRRFG